MADINRRLLVSEYFKGEQKISLNVTTISAERLSELEKLMGGGGSMVERESTEAFRVINDGVYVGTIVTASWRDRKFQGMFNWLFDQDGKVLSIQPFPVWPNIEISEVFEELLGMKLFDAEQCQTAAQLVGYELYFLSSSERY